MAALAGDSDQVRTDKTGAAGDRESREGSALHRVPLGLERGPVGGWLFLVVLNKVDTIDEELADALAAELEAEAGQKVLRVSGLSGEGVEAVLDKLIQHIGTLNRAAIEDDQEEPASDWSPL